MTGDDYERRLGQLVRDAAAPYEPRTDTIWARLQEPVVPAPRRARRWAAPLGSAMAAALVAVLAFAVVRVGGESGVPVAAPVPATPSDPAGTLLSGTSPPSGPSPAPDRAATPAVPSGPVVRSGPAVPSSPAVPSTDPGPSTAGLPQVDVRPLPAGSAITLDGSTGRDWVLPGVRRDGTVIRRKDPLLEVATEADGGTTGEPGPFRVSWRDGRPEQDRSDASGWLAGGWLRVAVPAGPGPRRLTLYVGTAGADCRVRVSAGGASRTVVLEAPAPAGVVTISAGPGVGPLSVEVTGVPRSPGGSAGVAAVVLA